jgi:hypothetical protein
MTKKQRANTTALPIDDRREIHQAGAGSGRSAPISLEQDKQLRDGTYVDARNERTHEPPVAQANKGDGIPAGDRVTSVDPKLVDEEVIPAQPERKYEEERKREERGNRDLDEEPASGQGA